MENINLNEIAKQTEELKKAVEVINAYIAESEKLAELTSIYNRCVVNNQSLLSSPNATTFDCLEKVIITEKDSREDIKNKLEQLFASNPKLKNFNVRKEDNEVHVCIPRVNTKGLSYIDNTKEVEENQVNFIRTLFGEKFTCFNSGLDIEKTNPISIFLSESRNACEITTENLFENLNLFKNFSESQKYTMYQIKCISYNDKFYLIALQRNENLPNDFRDYKYIHLSIDKILDQEDVSKLFKEIMKKTINKSTKKAKKEEVVKDTEEPVQEVKPVKTTSKRISVIERYNLTTIDPTTPERFTELLTSAGIFDSEGNYIANIKEVKYIGLYQLNNNQLAFKLYDANDVRPKKVLGKHRKNVVEIFPYQLHLNKKNVKEELLNTFKSFVSKCLPAIEAKKETLVA
jgi:hypothetical protein|nr:MAG TPA: hypothetical protein [Caudoviricetes sp.]